MDLCIQFSISYNAMYRTLASSIAKQVGADFIQGNNATTNLTDFSDGVHLNAVGADKLSELIGVELCVILKKWTPIEMFLSILKHEL